MKAQDIINHLVALNSLELVLQASPGEGSTTSVTSRKIQKTREAIPEEILAHYDRMRSRGKKGIASAEGFVCRACHLSIPTGNRARLQVANDLNVCDNCGTYLYLPEVQQDEVAA